MFEPVSAISAEAINQALREAAEGPLAGVLDVTDKELVSIDMNGCPASRGTSDQTRDAGWNGAVFSWYDNEWGFSKRMLDTASAVGLAAVRRSSDLNAAVAAG